MSGVVGVNFWNIIIIGLVAIVFVMAYNFVQGKYAPMLPRA
jgi:hypothetical protein